MTTTRRPYPTKQERMRNNPHARRLHEAALARALLMREMLDAGLTYVEVGRRFGVSEQAVKSALKRQGLFK